MLTLELAQELGHAWWSVVLENEDDDARTIPGRDSALAWLRDEAADDYEKPYPFAEIVRALETALPGDRYLFLEEIVRVAHEEAGR